MFFSFLYFFSQNNITISGYVDEISGEKLIGATIYDFNFWKRNHYQ